MNKWLLVDGFNLAFRSFYAVPELFRSDGLPTNAIHGWVRMLWKLQDTQQPNQMIIFFDLGGAQRQLELLPEYKAQRGETPEAFEQQIPWIKRVTAAMGYPIIEQSGVEADDLIASAAHQWASTENIQLYIVSADKDLAQCVNNQVYQLLPPPSANPRIGWRELDENAVCEKFKVSPNQIPDYLALIGDTSDNIPGIQGVGPKTASKWIQSYSTLQNVIKNAENLKPARFADIVKNSEQKLLTNLELITLKTDYKLSMPEKENKHSEELFHVLQELEMNNALKEAEKRYSFV